MDITREEIREMIYSILKEEKEREQRPLGKWQLKLETRKSGDSYYSMICNSCGKSNALIFRKVDSLMSDDVYLRAWAKEHKYCYHCGEHEYY